MSLVEKLKAFYHNSKLPYYYEKLRVPETGGMAVALCMVALSLISYFKTGDPSMIQNSALFFYMLSIRLILFFWNLATEKKPYVAEAQCNMMLVTAVTLWLTNVSLAVSIVRYVSVHVDKMNFPSHLIATIVYGVYTLGKIIWWISGVIKKRKINLYLETLSYLGWYSAFYTLGIFLVYMIYTENSGLSAVALRIIFYAALFSTVVLCTVMTVRSIRSFRKIRRAKKTGK